MPAGKPKYSELGAVLARGASHSSGAGSRSALSGFTLLEMMIVLAILVVLVSIAIPSYSEYLERGAILQAQADIVDISDNVHDYFLDRGQYPETLDEINLDYREDPWGNPYAYLRIEGVKGKGKLRKDKNLVPINSDYDLYSKGPDGRSVSPLTAKHSRDDIIRADNGGFIGVAQKY